MTRFIKNFSVATFGPVFKLPGLIPRSPPPSLQGIYQIGAHDFVEQPQMKPFSPQTKVRVLSIATAASARAAIDIWRINSDTPSSYSLRNKLLVRMVRYMMQRMTERDMCVLVPIEPVRKTLDKELSFMKTRLHHFNYIFHVDGTSARWLHEMPDRRRADPVLVYMHGGSYVLKAAGLQLKWACRFAERFKGKHHRLSVMTHDYALAPYKKYPHQLNEALALYKELQKTSDHIIILGDSAGANLAISLCAVLKKEYPELPKPWALILASPWTALVAKPKGSYEAYKFYDICPPVYDPKSILYATPEQIATDPLVTNILGDENYWENVLPSRTFVEWGECETLKDDIIKWCDIACIPQRNRFEEPGGVHDPLSMFDTTPGMKAMFHKLDEWLHEL